MLDKTTPLILTYNESSNIERTLKKLSWAKRVVVVDSFSEDKTIEILNAHPSVEMFQREFDTHTNQWNFGLKQINSEWVLSLDSDYVLSDELINEISNISSKTSIDGYFVPFKYCVFGKPLKGTILPPRQALFRLSKSIYVDDGHTQLLEVAGKSEQLNKHIFHDDRKPLARWLWAQDRYMIIEANKLIQTPSVKLGYGDKIRKQKFAAPLIIFFYCLILKGGVLDGWVGWYYAFQRMLAETLLSIRIIEQEKMH
ncbi:MAG: glycosyltransferase family 2 protein [Cyanobacteria bacterium J06600_6]